jgi:hypothetical protein
MGRRGPHWFIYRIHHVLLLDNSIIVCNKYSFPPGGSAPPAPPRGHGLPEVRRRAPRSGKMLPRTGPGPSPSGHSPPGSGSGTPPSPREPPRRGAAAPSIAPFSPGPQEKDPGVETPEPRFDEIFSGPAIPGPPATLRRGSAPCRSRRRFRLARPEKASPAGSQPAAGRKNRVRPGRRRPAAAPCSRNKTRRR